jgi:hypothetical protein
MQRNIHDEVFNLSFGNLAKDKSADVCEVVMGRMLFS